MAGSATSRPLEGSQERGTGWSSDFCGAAAPETGTRRVRLPLSSRSASLPVRSSSRTVAGSASAAASSFVGVRMTTDCTHCSLEREHRSTSRLPRERAPSITISSVAAGVKRPRSNPSQLRADRQRRRGAQSLEGQAQHPLPDAHPRHGAHPVSRPLGGMRRPRQRRQKPRPLQERASRYPEG